MNTLYLPHLDTLDINGYMFPGVDSASTEGSQTLSFIAILNFKFDVSSPIAPLAHLYIENNIRNGKIIALVLPL